ncbi:MAG: ATP-dependent helicase HrpA [Pseudonocardiales bacterium]|nr:ATP-dependent helicase HrpA [Pseudonocardiales bacterium]
MGESLAELRVARRQASVPRIHYPPALPISQHVSEIAAAIRDHQVVVIAGETGSGKTTQLPKICLELGRGVRGTIGHTQPRRLAARTVAERIAAELGVPVGDAVGWKVRFTDQASDATLIKLMTDGILLAEIQSDPTLAQYDTLIIDEAHERSLNIDFVLGYLKQLLPRRPDLKVIITSATIDPERFSRHFGAAPVIEVSGRTYPVEIRYRPFGPDGAGGADDRDQTQAICDAVTELRREGPGDILVFLSGEREIRDTRDALHALQLTDTEVLPLYGRLSAAEQHRVFEPPGTRGRHTGRQNATRREGDATRRIVLATNVAETSLTVPGIRYVIDPGTARISRYSRRLKVQRLPIEPVSQASATQRAGRCGRTAAGICIRLYTEQDFQSRPEFTDPEIVRTHLASVILQMAALDLGEVAEFPFIDPPDRRQISDGVALLRELGALQEHATPTLTRIGRTLAQLPLDPRLARMVVAAAHNGCLGEVLVIAAALSIQDPRERPTDAEAAADAQHARFTTKDSDFLAYLNLWRHLDEQQQALSSTQFRKLCKAEFLHYLRVREWQDLHGQLRRITRDMRIMVNTAPADPQQVHVSLLAGLLSHIGLFDPETRDYLGARGARFAVFPGSALFRKPPRWVMAAELVETSRLWGRVAARIEPQWVEPLAAHLVKRSYSEPHWECNRGAVVAYEKVTLYGIPIVTSRKVAYGRIDPECCRELFIRHALVAGDWETRHAFFHANRSLLDDVDELEQRARRRDIAVDDETLFDFYDQRIPAEVVSARHFDSWWCKVSKIQPTLLDFDPTMLIAGTGVSKDDYPDRWQVHSTSGGSLALELSYQFAPGADADGVTVHVPLQLLNQVNPAPFTWQVPGLREELVVALLKSLPKPLRRQLVPVPDYAKALLARMAPGGGPLLDALERALAQTGVPVRRADWRLDQLPDHLTITFRVHDGAATLAQGEDLAALTRRLQARLRDTMSAAGGGLERQGLRSWDVGTVPRTYQQEQAGHLITAYPALVDEGDTVALALLPTEAEQQRAMWEGTRRLLLLAVPGLIKSVQRILDQRARLVLARNPDGSVEALLADCASCAADALIAACGGPPHDENGFAALTDRAHAELAGGVRDVLAQVLRILELTHTVEARLAEFTAPILAPAVADIRAQLASLFGTVGNQTPGFVTAMGAQRLPDLARYLQAIARRLDKLRRDPDRDRDWMDRIAAVAQSYQQLRDELGDTSVLRRIRWMIEELRVSYFAQELRTPYPVSDQRIYQAIAAARGR